MGHSSRTLCLIGLATCLAACGSDSQGQVHQRLALGFSPPPLNDLKDLEWQGRPVTITSNEAEGARFSVELTPRSWESMGSNVWRAARPFAGLALGADSELVGHSPQGIPREIRQHLLPVSDQHQQVALQGVALDADLHSLLGQIKARPAFLLAGPWVYLLSEDSAAPPDLFRLSETLDLGSGQSGAWRVELGPYSVEGVPLLSSQSASFELEIEAATSLRTRILAVGDPQHEARFRATWNGRTVLDEAQSFDSVPQPRALDIFLGNEPGAGTLTLEVQGGQAGFTAFLKPVLCPPEDRLAESDALDVVLLLADTFRADNLAAWGGDPDLCPSLNEFAATGRRFQNARAPATWTLPSHAAMFSGLYPPQVSVRLFKDRLPEGAWTLAEHFQQAGYRTVALTDGGFVGRPFGFAQGFEWFEEGEVDVPRMLAAVQREVDADDGRPLFLFVQSYRAHEEYRVDEPTRARLGDKYPLDRPIPELTQAIAGAYKDLPRGNPVTGPMNDVFSAYERWYRGASADLGRAFGSILQTLARAGILDQGVVAFTSDHGESFGEHGVFGHGRGVWDEEALVPLVVRAPDLAPTDDSSPASLVDLPRTLTDLAGIAVHPDWIGRNLCRGSDTPPIVSYQSRPWLKQLDLAVVHRGRKWILDARDQQVLRVYDVARDPGELRNLHTLGSPEQLLDDLRTLLETLNSPLIHGQEAQTSSAVQAQLDAMGYGGAGEED